MVPRTSANSLPSVFRRLTISSICARESSTGGFQLFRDLCCIQVDCPKDGRSAKWIRKDTNKTDKATIEERDERATEITMYQSTSKIRNMFLIKVRSKPRPPMNSNAEKKNSHNTMRNQLTAQENKRRCRSITSKAARVPRTPDPTSYRS